MTHRRVWKAIRWGTMVGIVAFVGQGYIARDWQAERFIMHAVARMSYNGDPMRVPNAYIRRFADGSSIAIYMDHTYWGGAGFNATVIYDSQGNIAVNKTRCFSSHGELESVMDAVPATSLNQFYANLHDLPLTDR